MHHSDPKSITKMPKKLKKRQEAIQKAEEEAKEEAKERQVYEKELQSNFTTKMLAGCLNILDL